MTCLFIKMLSYFMYIQGKLNDTEDTVVEFKFS